MAKAVVLTNYGNWSSDSIGAYMVCDVSDNPSVDDLKKVAMSIAELWYVDESFVRKAIDNIEVNNSSSIGDWCDEDEISEYSTLSVDLAGRVSFDGATPLYVVLSLV